MSTINHGERPWMTALEMQFAAFRVVQSGTFTTTATNAVMGGAGKAALVKGLRAAEPFSWSNETRTAVILASRTMPPDATLEPSLVPCQRGWWYFGAVAVPCEAVLFSQMPEPGSKEFEEVGVVGLLVSVFTRDSELRAPGPALSFMWGYGESVGELVEGSGRHGKFTADQMLLIRSIGPLLLSGFAWLQQRIVTWSSGHVERHRRKQLTREYNADVSDVKVIQLRRVESQQHQSRNGEPAEWSCRWIVNGHWRNQPYKDERKLIYIMPYVKGPEDMPLKVPSHTVYVVNR